MTRVDSQVKTALYSVLAESTQPAAETLTRNAAMINSAAIRDAIAVPRQKFVGDVAFDHSLLVRDSLFDLIKKNPGITKALADALKPIDWAKLARAMPNPLFVKGAGDTDAVAMNDIDQNSLGDCWMMGPLAAVAKNDPQRIKDMVQDNHDGTYTVTFKEFNFFGGWSDKKITVTADFPGGINGGGHAGVGDKNIGGKGEIWPLIIEKAYAQYKGGYDKLNGGNPNEFMMAITGKFTTAYDKPFSLLGAGLNANQLQNDFNAGKPIVFSTPKTGALGYGLVNNHCYAVQNVYTDANGKKMVQLYNPWGNSHPSPIPYDDFINNFSQISVGF